eukprot:505717-Prorocentrum_minimum.AAC.3
MSSGVRWAPRGKEGAPVGGRGGRASTVGRGQGVVWSSEDARGPQHRLQTTNQRVQYVKGVHSLPHDHRLPATVMFRKLGSVWST